MSVPTIPAYTAPMEAEVTYLSGFDANSLLAPQSFWRWNGNTPAGYRDTYNVGKWGSPTLGTSSGTIHYWFDPAIHFTGAEKDMVAACFAMWSAVANVQFAEVSSASAAQVTFTGQPTNGQYASNNTGRTLSSNQHVGTLNANSYTSAILTIDTILRLPSDFAPGGFWYVIEHEMGHVLGLGHAGPYVTTIDPMRQQFGPYDCFPWTLMSYIKPADVTAWSASYPLQQVDWRDQYPTTVMPLDIIAIQRLYGKPTNTPLGGGQTFGFNCNVAGPIGQLFDFTKNTRPVITIWDAGNNNTLDLSGFADRAFVNLNAGTFSSVAGLTDNLAIAFDTAVDTLVCGSGDTTVICNNDGDTVRGGSGHETITLGSGNDTVDGGANVDTVVLSGRRSAAALTQTSTGVWQVVGPDGTDTLANIEYARFDDATVRLLPGAGTAVDWNASPSTYMSGIRDFDGSDLGGAASWKLIGTADVNGDGMAEHILFNKEIGRWAEVGTEADGKTYFANNGWAGDTRVVGIYVDPLVANGTVVRGSDTDSQRRFQNDLMIDNINGILGQGDYNHDGLQEIYFSLTDGTAYLHAYMHADGNIQYANYQSKQQVIDYLTSNGVSSSTWATWFPASQTPMLAVLGG